MATVEYKTDNVLAAAQKRIARVFDDFQRVVVSVSSGKDSTVLFHLAIAEAERRGRQVELFFLDQEAEYQSTVDLINEMMRHPLVVPLWLQIPIKMTNSTSHKEYFLNAWEEGAEWVHPRSPIAVHELDGAPDRFYELFSWLEAQAMQKTAWLIGLRSKESFNRFRAVTKNPGWDGLFWSTKTVNPLSWRFYPIFDWTFGDVWKYIFDNNVKYNPHYDRMFAKYGINMSKMRVSNLIHEKSFRCLVDLQEFEPETYERLVRRLSGVHAAALYAKEKHVFDAKDLPAHFASWREYRNYLISTTPIDKVERFTKRFAGQATDEDTCRQQVKQILVNDWENSIPVSSKQGKLKELWWDKL